MEWSGESRALKLSYYVRTTQARAHLHISVVNGGRSKSKTRLDTSSFRRRKVYTVDGLSIGLLIVGYVWLRACSIVWATPLHATGGVGRHYHLLDWVTRRYTLYSCVYSEQYTFFW